MSALPLTRRVPRLWLRRSRAWRASMRPTCSADRIECVMLNTCGISLVPTIMPPNTVMVLIGGRSLVNTHQAPGHRIRPTQ